MPVPTRLFLCLCLCLCLSHKWEPGFRVRGWNLKKCHHSNESYGEAIFCGAPCHNAVSVNPIFQFLAQIKKRDQSTKLQWYCFTVCSTETYLASNDRRAVMKSFTSEVLRANALESKDHLPFLTASPTFSSSSSSSLHSTANGRIPLNLENKFRFQHDVFVRILSQKKPTIDLTDLKAPWEMKWKPLSSISLRYF